VPPSIEPSFPRWFASWAALLPVVAGSLALVEQIPGWLIPFAVLTAGGAGWYTVHRRMTESARTARQMTVLAVVTSVLAMGLAVHRWPALAGLDPAQRQEKNRQQNTPSASLPVSKASDLKVTSLHNDECISRTVNIKGTGTIPAGSEIWVGHSDDVKGVPAEALMNVRQAEPTGVPGQWQTGDFEIGNKRDNRTFWVFVFVLPDAAGYAISHQAFPDHFFDKENWQNWQTSLTRRFAEGNQLAVFKVYRSPQGC